MYDELYYIMMLYCRPVCTHFIHSYIIMYPSYLEEGRFSFFCGNYASNWIATVGSHFAYVKYRAASRINYILYRGFSSARYVAQGLVTIAI